MAKIDIEQSTAASVGVPDPGRAYIFVDSTDDKPKVVLPNGDIISIVDTDVLAKVTTNDTTSGFLDDKIVVSTGLVKTILNPGGNEQIQISAGARAIFQAHQQVVQDPVTSATPLLCDTSQVNTVPATIGYVPATGVITLNNATSHFKISVMTTFDTADGSRQGGKMQVQIDTGGGFVDLPSALGPSVTHSYHRNNASGESTATYSAILPLLAVGTNLRFMISTINTGTIKTVPAGCGITIEQL